MKKTLAALMTLAMLFCLAACSGGDGDKGAAGSAAPSQAAAPSSEPTDSGTALSGEPIKIGHIVDLNGTEAMTGQEAKRSLEFAVEHLQGIAGRPVEIVLGDAQGTTEGAVDVARKMVESDHVAAILGPTQAGQKAAVAEYAKDAGVPVIYYNGTPAYLFNGNQWLIGAGGANPQMNIMADYVYNDLGYRKVNILVIDNMGFRGFADDFTKVFTALGGEIASDQYAPFGSDWSNYLVAMDSDADALLAWVTGSDAIALWTTWYQMGLNETMPMQGIMGSAFTDYFILSALESTDPAMADAVLDVASPAAYCYDIDNPENRAFVEAWTESFGAVPSTNLPGQVYQGYQLLKAAIESIDGSTEPEAVRDALLTCTVDGPTGRLAFDGSSAGTKDMYIVKTVRLEDGSYNYQTVKSYPDVPPTGFSAP